MEVLEMGQESNDISQLKRVIRELANVYKSQAIDDLIDNGNLEEINKAIIHTENALQILQQRSRTADSPARLR